ncbi:hypothetical protein D3C72_2143600 [compost metagenome]
MSTKVSLLSVCEYTFENIVLPYQFSKSELSVLFSVKMLPVHWLKNISSNLIFFKFSPFTTVWLSSKTAGLNPEITLLLSSRAALSAT